jgi:hypothetical protein
MKTIAVFTTATLATVVLATAADADVQGPRCGIVGKSGTISVRAGTPCVFGTGPSLRWNRAARPQGLASWKGMMLHSTEIIEPPHEGTAVLRADGRVYYSPKPGFTGRDGMRVIFVLDSCQVPEKLQVDPAWCRKPYLTLAVPIFVE